jgi:hypothetical protein
MPRYYFHVYNGRSVIDQDGTDHRDHAEAKIAGSALATDLARLYLGLTGHPPTGRVIVVDERGNQISVVPMSVDP